MGAEMGGEVPTLGGTTPRKLGGQKDPMGWQRDSTHTWTHMTHQQVYMWERNQSQEGIHPSTRDAQAVAYVGHGHWQKCAQEIFAEHTLRQKWTPSDRVGTRSERTPWVDG